jgi:uncharacterized protein involved in exopolysaccharide biosynthesis
MAKKGKEIDLGGLRVQVDPMVLTSRIVLRQKALLAAIALIGGLVTVVWYVETPKKYEAHSNILIRYENFEENFLQKLLNVSVGYLGSDTEMMLIINELDLYAKMRSRLPYEMALREMRIQLAVRSQPRSITIAYLSPDAHLAERVVAFTTERLLSKMAELNEAPFNRKLEAINRTVVELDPKREEAVNKLFDFKNKHPEIAISIPDLAPPSSPIRAIDDEIRKAERDLAAAQSGLIVAPERATERRRDTEATRRLRDLENALLEAKQRYTENHPEVQRLTNDVALQKQVVSKEAARLDGVEKPAAGANPEEIKNARIAAAKARLAELIQRKTETEAQAIGKPKLQREWSELSLNASTLQSQYRSLNEEREKILRDRLVSANDFQENFQLVDAARVPELPTEPSRQKFMVLGMVITAVFGLLVAAAREALRQTFVDANEFEEQAGLQVFAVLPTINTTKEAKT